MKQKINVSSGFYITTGLLIAIGIITLILGFVSESSVGRSWANILLNNYYFLSLSIGAAFFLAIQYITQSGWSAMFKRIPEAMSSYLPIALIFTLLLLLGSHYLYHWSDIEYVKHDEILMHKAPYLNLPFFCIRIVIFFGAWILLTRLLRKWSLKEDIEGGMSFFIKSEFYSRVFIFVLAVTFSLLTFDLIMSIDAHWFSTIFAVKNFIAAFLHGVTIITLIVIILNKLGYIKDLNKSHLHDFSRYIFILSIMWCYFWFSQYILIWYANIPEETVYYVTRFEDQWKPFFLINIVLNWLFPFLFLMSNKVAKNANALLITAIVLIAGQWVDLYIQIMPGSVGKSHFGFIEIGSFLGFLGLFSLIVVLSLKKANIIPVNHPYLEESVKHHTH